MKDESAFSFRKFFANCAIFGFAASVLINLSTFIGFNQSHYICGIWLLQIGIFLVFIPMLVSKMLEKEGGRQGSKWKDFFKPMPHWAKYFVIGLFVYAILNFILFLAFTQEGVLDEVNGKYVLRQGGRGETPIIRELNEAEYANETAKFLRGFSGIWMLLYLLPGLYFPYPKNNKEGDSDAENLTFSV